jgi:hypothetical protein
MSQIKITILKEVQQPNVIACSFFTMTDSYRAFGKYKTHLEVFLKYTKKLTDFEVRIYTDDTGSDFALEVSKDYPNVSVHHFYKVIERFCDSLKLIDEKIGKAS